MTHPILVTGAAGRVGGVGGLVVEALQRRGLPVRAMVRREDERAEALEFQAGGAPARRLRAGDTFYEPAMVLHAVARNPSDKARTRVLVVIIHPRESKALVVPEPARGGR